MKATYHSEQVSEFSLTLSHGHIFTKMCDTTKGDKVTKSNKIVTNRKVHCVMQL